MQIKTTALWLLLFPLALSAQKKDKNAVNYASTITTTDLQKHLVIVAGAEMEGRNTPSVGLDKAADYIESQFKAFGVLPGNKDSYRQVYPLFRDTVTGSSLRVNEAAFEHHRSFVPLSGTLSGSLRFSEIVFAGYGISDGEVRDDYKGLNVAGKLVLIADGSPAGYTPKSRPGFSPNSFNGKIAAAGSRGAAAVLILFNNFPRNPAPARPAGWSPYAGYPAAQSPLAFSVGTDVAEALTGISGKTLLEKAGDPDQTGKTYKARVEMSYERKWFTAYASNVVGIVEGSDKKDEYLVITAHYDHLGKRDNLIYYGADDDGSGTVGVMEMAEAFAKAKAEGKGPRRTIIFMLVSGEEKGLWGSGYYANNPLFPLEKTTANLNIDMIGRTDTSRHTGDSSNYVYVVGDDKLSTELKPISEGVNKLYAKMELDYKFNDPKDPNRIYFRSDHYNFAAKGVPIIFYYDGMLKSDYHKPTDTHDKINYPLMVKRARLIFHTAWEMANREEMVKRDLKLDVPARN